MKAWRIERHGGSQALQRVELPDRVPGPLEARVRIEALGVNHLDVWVRRGVPGHQFPLPIIPGCDASGTIDSLGPGAADALEASALKKGSAVIINPGISCGRCEACLGGSDPLCQTYGIFGEHRDGAAADYLVVPVNNLIARPAGMSAVVAAALPIPYLTAWSMIFNKAHVRPGEWVLVQAAGSGVSIAAIQILKMIGANVITTAGTPEKVQKAQALGADYVINYRAAPFRDQLKSILKGLGKRGVDVAIDHVGVDTFVESLRSLAWGGRLVTCGATTGSQVTIDLKAVFFKNLSILGSTMGSKADLIRIVKLVDEGKLKPLIDSVYPMIDYPLALERIEQRNAFGKIVVEN